MSINIILKSLSKLSINEIETIIPHLDIDIVLELLDEVYLYDVLNEAVVEPATNPEVTTEPVTESEEEEEEETDGKKKKKKKKKKKSSKGGNGETEEDTKSDNYVQKVQQQADEPNHSSQYSGTQQQYDSGYGGGYDDGYLQQGDNPELGAALDQGKQMLTYAAYPHLSGAASSAVGGLVAGAGVGAKHLGRAIKAGSKSVAGVVKRQPIAAAVTIGALALTGGLVYLFRKYYGDQFEKKFTRAKAACENMSTQEDKIKCQISVANQTIQMINSTMSKSTDMKEKERLNKERDKYKKIIQDMNEKLSKERLKPSVERSNV
jgi:ribosomal protein L12E/L44/L45/RPP1/RPP2